MISDCIFFKLKDKNTKCEEDRSLWFTTRNHSLREQQRNSSHKRANQPQSESLMSPSLWRWFIQTVGFINTDVQYNKWWIFYPNTLFTVWKQSSFFGLWKCKRSSKNWFSYRFDLSSMRVGGFSFTLSHEKIFFIFKKSPNSSWSQFVLYETTLLCFFFLVFKACRESRPHMDKMQRGLQIQPADHLIAACNVLTGWTKPIKCSLSHYIIHLQQFSSSSSCFQALFEGSITKPTMHLCRPTRS